MAGHVFGGCAGGCASRGCASRGGVAGCAVCASGGGGHAIMRWRCGGYVPFAMASSSSSTKIKKSSIYAAVQERRFKKGGNRSPGPATAAQTHVDDALDVAVGEVPEVRHLVGACARIAVRGVGPLAAFLPPFFSWMIRCPSFRAALR